MRPPEPPAARHPTAPRGGAPDAGGHHASRAPGIPGPAGSRYGWFVGVVALLVIALITVNTITTAPNGAAGIAAGRPLPPFAVPLALGPLNGDADIAIRPHEGGAGNRPACTVRGPQVLNVCQLYERGPVVLALFVARQSCAGVLDDIQQLTPSFPGVQFAAVAIRGDRANLRSLIRSRGWTFPVGYDRDGAVANLYKLASCPQVTLAYPGGVVAERAFLTRPAPGTLRARVAGLVAASRARGWRPPA